MKNYTIAGIIIAIILVVGAYFQIQANKKMNENMPMAGVKIMEEQKNDNQPQEELIAEILQEGAGPEAKNGDTVFVNYIGAFEDGTVFDSNESTSSPFSFILGQGQVITGWDRGVLGMKKGEKRKLTIPSDLAYGPTGRGSIPPNATLIFEVFLLNIESPSQEN